MGRPAKEWFVKKGIPASDDLLHRTDDIQFARLFPVCAGQEEMISVLQWMITENEDRDGNEEKVGREIWLKTSAYLPMKFHRKPIFKKSWIHAKNY